MKKTIILITLISLLSVQITNAQIGFRLKERTDKYFQLNPGESIESSLDLINQYNVPTTIKIYTSDGTSTNTGSFTVKTRTQEKNNVGLWITPETNLITLNPLETKELHYTINIPENTTPGDYGGGISAEPTNTSDTSESSGTRVIVSTRIVNPIFITVKGEKITDYNWDKFTHQYDNRHIFQMDFINKGNTIIKINGTIEIRDIFQKSSSIPINEITLLNNETTQIKKAWQEKPFWGIFTATAKLTVEELDPVNQTFSKIEQLNKGTTFTVIPWIFLFILTCLVVLIISAFKIKKNIFNNYKKKCSIYEVRESDTINKIATQLNVQWKLIAKINDLKPPYNIEPGQKILVPSKKQ